MGFMVRSSNPHTDKKFLFFPNSTPPMWPIQPPVQWVPGFFLEINRPRREVDHSGPSSAKVENEWRYNSTPPICFHGLDRDKFTVNWYDLFSLSLDRWQTIRRSQFQSSRNVFLS